MDEAAVMVYFSVVYILWGVTYTMMDIPYWSMIPAVTRTPKDRENLSMVGRTCAGVGSALIAMFTMLLVGALGGDSERAGFRWVALIVAAIFAVTELVCCISMKETTPSEMKTATVKEMFSALFRNDQAMVVVGSIVLINSALYLTSNFIIYFFKYDLGGAGWKATYTLFSTVGGAAQILGMMVLYPLLRKKFSSTQVFHLSLVLALCGYGTLLVFCLTGLSHSLALLCIPGVVVFACNGMLTVLTTLFLSNSVDSDIFLFALFKCLVDFLYKGVIIEVNSRISFIDVIGEDIVADAGAKLSAVAVTAMENDLGGFEFAHGIPGNIGGAVMMNAGAYGGEMKQVLKWVKVLDNEGNIITLDASELEMGYRTSIIEKKGYIVLQARIGLNIEFSEDIGLIMQMFMQKRRASQPLEYPSAGSTFKRPEGYFAGKLIDDAGLRGYRDRKSVV